MVRRRTVLAILLSFLVPAFLLTRTLVGSYRDSRHQLAVEWALRGDRDLQRSRPADAVGAYRTALYYSGESAADRLRLAQALVASNRPAEAEANLLTLWSDEPGNGTVNLTLARLATARGAIPDATRYYHAAIDGSWPSNGAAERRKVRFELTRMLIAAGRRQEAQAELIALADNAADDPVDLAEVGALMAKAGADQRALQAFQRVLALEPGDRSAAAQAGDVAYRLGDLVEARRYLVIAGRNGALPPALNDELQISSRVLAFDPFARGIPLRQRAARTLEIFGLASRRLAACVSGVPADQQALVASLSAAVERIAPRLGRRSAERNDDLVDEALNTAFAIEQLPASVCGQPSVDDRAIALIARERQGR